MRIILIAILSLLVSLTAVGETIESDIIKFQHNRFYFSLGEEAMIFAGNKFQIFESDSLILSGLIEKSFEGISISTPVDSTLNFDPQNIIAIVQTAEYDTIPTLTVGYYNRTIPDLLQFRTKADTIFFNDSNLTTINFENLYDRYIIEDSLYQFDILSSFTLHQGFLKQSNYIYDTVSYPLGYLVVLIPNLSKEVNKNGVLTTSLFYRYSKDLMSHFYSGDIIEADCLFPSDTGCVRSYTFNLEKGQKLSKALANRYPLISISYNNYMLKEAAEYYADILSRDRFDILIAYDSTEVDLFVNLIPYKKSDPGLSIKEILSELNKTEHLTQGQKETLDIIANRLEMADNSDNRDLKNYYWQLADYTLKYELGVFPLFRPKIYCAFKEQLRGIAIDQDGIIDLTNLKKLKGQTNFEKAHRNLIRRFKNIQTRGQR